MTIIEVCNVTFTDCSPKNIYITSADASKLIKTTRWRNMTYTEIPIATHAASWAVDNKRSDDSAVLHYLFAASTDATVDTVYGKTDGEDIGTCGWEDIPSLSIYSASSPTLHSPPHPSLFIIANHLFLYHFVHT